MTPEETQLFEEWKVLCQEGYDRCLENIQSTENLLAGDLHDLERDILVSILETERELFSMYSTHLDRINSGTCVVSINKDI